MSAPASEDVKQKPNLTHYQRNLIVGFRMVENVLTRCRNHDNPVHRNLLFLDKLLLLPDLAESAVTAGNDEFPAEALEIGNRIRKLLKEAMEDLENAVKLSELAPNQPYGKAIMKLCEQEFQQNAKDPLLSQ